MTLDKGTPLFPLPSRATQPTGGRLLLSHRFSSVFNVIGRIDAWSLEVDSQRAAVLSAWKP